MIRKLLLSVTAVCCCAAMTGSLTAAAFTADEAAKVITDYVKRAENLQYTPIRPAEIGEEGRIYVSQYAVELFGVLAVTCTDYDALAGTEIASHPININKKNGAEDDSVIIWPYSRYVERLREWVPKLSDTMYDLDGNELDTDGLYVMDLSCFTDDLTGFIGKLMEDPRFGLLGLAYMHYDWKTIYNGDVGIYLEPAEGCEIDDEALNTPQYRNLEPDSEGIYRADAAEKIPYEEAAALCGQLEERPEIASAWLVGDSPFDNDEELKEIIRLQMNLFVHYGSGDLNQDGRINICDAVLLARCIAEDPETPVTEKGLAEADLNGDRVLDAADQSAMLRLLAGCESESEEE